MKLRRIFSLLIAAAFIVSMLPLGAIATDHEELISEAVAAPLGEGGENPEGAPVPDEIIELPEGEPEGGDDLPSDVIGDPGAGDPGAGDPGTGDPGAGDPGTGDPGTGDPGTGDPGASDPGAGDPGTGETPEEPGEGDPAEGEDPEQPEEGEDPDAGEEGEEGEEAAEEPVDVTTLLGEALARYIEELEANEDYDALDALLDIMTEEQFQSLIGVSTTSWTIAEMMRAFEQEEIIEYYPASGVPAGPIIQGSNAFGQIQMDAARQAAGRMIVGAAGFGAGLLSTPALPDFKNPPSGMTVDKTATAKNYPGGGSNDRQFFQLDLTVHAESQVIITSKPADIVLVLDVSGSMNDNLPTTYTYTQITGNPRTSNSYYINVNGNWTEVFYRSRNSSWYYWSGSTRVYVTHKIGGTGQNGEYHFHTRTQTTITKLQALKNTVNSFLASVYAQSPESKVAIVTYASSGNSIVRTGTQTANAGALVSVKNGGSFNSALTTVVNGLSAGGGTRADEGFSNATKILQADTQTDRSRVVIHFTDGDPGDRGFDDWPDYAGEKTAADVIRWAKVLKNDRGVTTDVSNISFSGYNGNDTISNRSGCGATVYTIGIFSNPSSKTHQYMWRSSSETKTGAAKSGGNPDYSPDAPGNQGYYLTANSADSLDNIFNQISKEIGEAIENATVRDYISEEFEICDASGTAIIIDGVTLPVTVNPGTANEFKIYKDDQNRVYAEWINVNLDPGGTFTGTVFVKPKADFIGGNNLLTNLENISAVYNGDEILASFPKPAVNVPISLGTGAYSDDIYLGDTISAGMVSAAEADMLLDIFKGNDYSAIGSVNPSWTTDPTGAKPTNASNNYGYSVSVTPVAPLGASVGNPATAATASGTYTVNVYGATLSATGFTILKGQTAVLSNAVKTLNWSPISGKPVPTDVDYEIRYNGSLVTSDPQLTEGRTFSVLAKRNGVDVASTTFAVEVVAPTFTGATYNILLGEKVGDRYTVSNDGVSINYSGTGGLEYAAGELTFTPDTTGYGSPIASHVPSLAKTYTVPVTVTYTGSSIQIGSATVTINVSVPAFTGKSFHLLSGELASADGYNAHGDGITIDYTGISGLTYPSSLTYDLAEGSTLPDSRLTGNAVNKINVSYNGTVIAQNVEVNFTVYTPAFAGNTFNLFYGETVKGAYPSVTTAAGAITINAPASWPADRSDRWDDYKAKITAEAAAEYANALDTVYAPASPAAQFPMTMKYVYGTGPSDFVTLATGDDAPKITINVVAGSITITKSVTNTGNKGTVDPDQTFLFEITGPDGTFYEYLTGSGSKAITGLKKGAYTVTEVTDWSWRYDLVGGNNKQVHLGQDAEGDRDIEAVEGSAAFTNNKTTDSWLGDEATPKANACGPVAQTELAILPGKQNGLPEDGAVEEA